MNEIKLVEHLTHLNLRKFLGAQIYMNTIWSLYYIPGKVFAFNLIFHDNFIQKAIMCL